jgi:hypothetical protein
LNDYFKGKYKKEKNILIDSISEGIPRDLLQRSGNLPYDMLLRQYIIRMQHWGFDQNLSRWVVDSWAIGFNIIEKSDSEENSGYINITSTPSGVNVYLDTALKGRTPISLKDVPAGTHLLKCMAKGYQDWQMNIEIIAGEHFDVIAKLNQESVKTIKPSQLPVSIGGVPQIEIIPLRFNFLKIKNGSSISEKITISNIGGGVLTGSISSNKAWLIPSSDKIDPSKHKQIVSFTVDTSGLPLGFSDDAVLNVDSNGGKIQLPIFISIEIPRAALSRFNWIVQPAFAIIFAALGIFIGDGVAIWFGIIGYFSRCINRFYDAKNTVGQTREAHTNVGLIGIFFWPILSAIIFYTSMKGYAPIGGYAFCGILFSSVFKYTLNKELFKYHTKRKNPNLYIIIWVIACIALIGLFVSHISNDIILWIIIGVGLLGLIETISSLEN